MKSRLIFQPAFFIGIEITFHEDGCVRSAPCHLYCSMKLNTNNTDSTYITGLISRYLPVKTFSKTYDSIPKTIPSAML